MKECKFIDKGDTEWNVTRISKFYILTKEDRKCSSKTDKSINFLKGLIKFYLPMMAFLTKIMFSSIHGKSTI